MSAVAVRAGAGGAPAAPPAPPGRGRVVPLRRGSAGAGATLYYSMKHRTQLYLDEGQYRWLKERAGEGGSIAAVVRELVDAERARLADPGEDPLLRFLGEEPAAAGDAPSSVETLDRDVYGA